ncbi:LysR family transcriptional regulator [Piscinibacter koreensis]|uniref:LysR family transcriptional regulator n=1 Tax=Piscinibacter koreensis TaxID=2742824 RepID=A0A7Y6TY89_9BURK|nr:LysR family transcriptional regulator [Schlegelella koreensis]NUZ07954.1 LysR family transcriptional regulator [Schlegelella koreensis]
MNVRHLKQFVAVADARSFRKASLSLHMAQPPLTVAIKRLEESLGGPLFVRSRQGVQLTAMGEAVLPDARRAVFHAEQVRAAATHAAAGIGGTLRIGFIGSATYTLFPKVLPEFRKAYPSITLDMRERTTTNVLREVESGDLDVGLIRHPVLEATTARIEPVEFDELVVAVPASHPIAGRGKVSLSQLREEPFIMYSSSAAPNLRGLVMVACQTAGFVPRVVQEAVQIQTIVSLVESGLGVALVPSVCTRHATRHVVFKRLSSPRERTTIAIALASRSVAEPETAIRFRAMLIAYRDGLGLHPPPPSNPKSSG